MKNETHQLPELGSKWFLSHENLQGEVWVVKSRGISLENHPLVFLHIDGCEADCLRSVGVATFNKIAQPASAILLTGRQIVAMKPCATGLVTLCYALGLSSSSITNTRTAKLNGRIVDQQQVIIACLRDMVTAPEGMMDNAYTLSEWWDMAGVFAKRDNLCWLAEQAGVQQRTTRPIDRLDTSEILDLAGRK